MGIPNDKLEQWRKRGQDTKSSDTYDVICKLFKDYCSDIIDVNSDNIFIQGSYANHTNIKNDSDIDIVVLSQNVFSNNAYEKLNNIQYAEFKRKYSDSEKTILSFKEEIYRRLNGKKLNNDYIHLIKGCKTIKFNQNNDFFNYVPVDIIPAFEYRYYNGNNGIDKNNQPKGIKLLDECQNEYIINYPQLHKRNGEMKNKVERTQGNYKETIRIFKNIKKHMIELGVIKDDLMPSYCLECLLYNVPDTLFNVELYRRVDSILAWLIKNVNENFLEQSEMYYLFTRSLDRQNADIFLDRCKWLAENWR